MIGTTYLVAVLVVAGLAKWVLWRRGSAGAAPAAGRPSGSRGSDWLRVVLAGESSGDDDAVDSMARCLMDSTECLGQVLVIPGYLGVVLPEGVYAAACAAKPRLTEEVVARLETLINDRARRAGRGAAASTIPADYVLRLVLTQGPRRQVQASFTPIAEIADRHVERAGVARRGAQLESVQGAAQGRTGPSWHNQAKPEDITVCRGADRALEFVLEVNGDRVAQCCVDPSRPQTLMIGRSSRADLRCPAQLREASREHAEITYAEGRTWVEDKHSSNGTWLEKPGSAPERLDPGARAELGRGDVIWLDADHRATVSQL